MYVMCGMMNDAHLLFCRRLGRGHLGLDGNAMGNGSVGVDSLCQRRIEGNVVMWNVMIDGYMKLGEFGAAQDLFDKMPHRSVVSWNALIAGYAQNGRFREAIEVFKDMQGVHVNVKPNYVTLVSVLPAISHLGALELGKWVHLYAGKIGIEIDDVLGML